jgi:putative tryptophan/tyrosine transport system substrate-binding protein
MRRREFIAGLGGAAVWQVVARAQQSKVPMIGFLSSGSPGPFALLLAAFHQGLKDGGYVEGRNVAVEYRWAEGRYVQLPALAAGLVRRRVAVIAATGGTLSARAAKAATATIPVLFVAADPVGDGLVASFSRPGGNVTGISVFTTELAPKRLQWLRELVPKAGKIATLINSANVTDMQETEAVNRAGLQVLTIKAEAESDFEAAFTEAAQQGVDALLVSADPLFNARRAQLVALAARHSLPAAYPWREYVAAGGLMSYGTSLAGTYRQVGQYVSRVLKGDKPADLPVQNPTKFELVINTKTAKALGLIIPETLLATADGRGDDRRQATQGSLVSAALSA